MKLYSTITSERASKGQGGNKYIDIVLSRGSASESVEEYKISFTNDVLSIYHNEKNEITIHNNRQKGKQWKAESVKARKGKRQEAVQDRCTVFLCLHFMLYTSQKTSSKIDLRAMKKEKWYNDTTKNGKNEPIKR